MGGDFSVAFHHWYIYCCLAGGLIAATAVRLVAHLFRGPELPVVEDASPCFRRLVSRAATSHDFERAIEALGYSQDPDLAEDRAATLLASFPLGYDCTRRLHDSLYESVSAGRLSLCRADLRAKRHLRRLYSARLRRVLRRSPRGE